MKGLRVFGVLAAVTAAALLPAESARAVPAVPAMDCAAVISLISDPNVSVAEKKVNTHTRAEINECRLDFQHGGGMR
ncbi:hypothetical protein WDV06_26830 [Streptomyces racemochromogenes]|uniref:Uncharacterized protein n=1 Tax=Streptomyces racemochromogenes TaxID=67353 RepID=A0ABW7PKA1_9ACTN